MLHGTVDNLRESVDGKRHVLRFRVKDDHGETVAVEMRGEELRGVLNEGDRIAVTAEVAAANADDKTLRPREVKNLTTGGRVEMWRPGLVQMTVRAIPVSALVIAVLSAAVGATVGAVVAQGLAGAGEAPLDPINPPSPSGTVVSDEVLLLIVAVVGVAVVPLGGILERRFGWRPVVALVGLYVGFALVAVSA